MTMTLELSDDILLQSKLTEMELRFRLGILLFQEERLTLGQAAKLAGMHQLQFQQELAKRKIPLHYGIEELERDAKNLKLRL